MGYSNKAKKVTKKDNTDMKTPTKTHDSDREKGVCGYYQGTKKIFK